MGFVRSEGDPNGGSEAPAGVRWVVRPDQLATLVEELRSVEAYAVDTEFHREKTYYPQLVDPLAVDLGPFRDALTGPAVVVMHAATQDLEVLDLACGVLPGSLFDTQLAAGFVSHSLPSLSALAERYVGVHLPKGDRLTDWLRRPLGTDQCTYAVADVDHLLELRRVLTEELTERGRLGWFQAECELVRQRGAVVRDPEESWRRIKESRTLRGEQAAVARAVAAWRERRAMELDQPVRFVLSDMAIMGIAQRRPKTVADLGRIRGVDERQAKGRVGEAILEAVATGLATPVPKQASTRPELDRHLRPAVALVSAWVSQLSREMEIETSLLATRSDIEALLAGDPDARLSTGWRAELVGERIRHLVDGRAALAFDGRGNLVLEDRVPPA